MDDAVPVGRLERLRYEVRDAEGIVERKLRLSDQPGPERFPLEIGHGVPRHLGSVAAADHPGIKHRDYVGMLQLSCYSNFTKEPVPADHPSQLRMEQLDGDQAVMLPISGEPDRAHPPST